MPSATSAPLRSTSRNISSPIASQRPERFQISAGCSAGSLNSWPPIASISARTIRVIFWHTRCPSGSSE